MNKKLLILLIFIFSTFSSYGDGRRNQLLLIINEELNELSRLNKQIGSRKPDVLLRLAELYLEKARIIREDENQRFLRIDSRKRAQISKKEFYAESRKNFVSAQKTCYFLLKRFPKYKRKGYVYFVLAYNAKEFQKINQAKKFFEKAIRSTSRTSDINRKSKLALAEIYYNMSRYNKAIPLYEGALKLKRDKWWTKDSFNLSWCYFRVGKKKKAIALMKDVNTHSSNKNFVDMRQAVQRDLAYFYADVGKVNQAVDFYKTTNRSISKSLLGVGQHLMSKGKNKEAKNALEKALSHADNDKTRIQIDMNLLTLFEDQLDYSNHYKVTERMFGHYKRNLLNKTQRENLKYHVKKMSASLQKQVVGKTYIRMLDVRKSKAALAIKYFNILESLNPNKAYVSQLHAGETSYAIGDFNGAIPFYDSSYRSAVRIKDDKISKVALNGLMASLGKKNIDKSIEDKYLISSYEFYLSSRPRGKRAFKLYQRLFHAYREQGNIAKAEATLYRFKDYFPKALKKQEAMLASIMDHYKDNGDKASIQRWVRKINDGEFVVTKKYARKVQLLLLSLQFENVQKFSSEGEKIKALRGYHHIYKSDGSSAMAKRNASYNIAILYYELGDTNNMYKWADNSLQLMKSYEVTKFEESFLLFSNELFQKGEFEKGADLNEKTLTKVCNRNIANKDSFARNGVVMYLAEKQSKKAYSFYNKVKKCNVSKKTLRELGIDLAQDLINQKRWQSFKKLSDELEKDLRAVPYLLPMTIQLVNAYKDIGNTNKANIYDKKIGKYYKIILRNKMRVPVEVLDYLARKKVVKVRRLVDQLSSKQLSFPEKKYNATLKSKFKILDRIVAETLEVFKMGSGEGIVSSYKALIDSHRMLARQIDNFSPANKTAKYIESFKKQMESLIVPLRDKAEQYKIEAIEKINDDEILSWQNYEIVENSDSGINFRFFPHRSSIIMDRGGKR